MSSTSGHSRQSELQHQLDKIIQSSRPLPINWSDEDHRPLINGTRTAHETELDGFDPLRAMLLDFLEESGAKDEEIRNCVERTAHAIGVCKATDSSLPAAAVSNTSKERLRGERSVYASRKASDLELLTTVAPILRTSCRTPLDEALRETTPRLEMLAAIIIEKIDEFGRSETIGAGLLYRGDGRGRFLASPLYTVVDLQPDIYAYSASHLVRMLREEVRGACDVGRLAYVADSAAHIYKAVVQMTAHCEFRSLHTEYSSDTSQTLYSLLANDPHFSDAQLKDDETWLESLFARARSLDKERQFDVAISSVSKTVDAVTLAELKRKISQTLRQFFGDLSVLGPHREPTTSKIAVPPARVDTLIQDALAERPGRRIFAAADGGRTVWTSDDAFSGEAP